MATVGISYSASTAPRPLRPALWFARPRTRHSLHGAVGLRRLVVASDRQEFFTQKSDEKWYCTSGYGTSRPPQVPGSSFSPIFVRDKRNMIDGPGHLQENDQGVASKATLSNNSHLWREKGESIFKTVTASKLLQRLKEDSHSLRTNCLTCSSTAFKEFPDAVTGLNEIFLHEDAHTLVSQLEPSSFSKEVDHSNVNCTEQHNSASPPTPERPEEAKTLIGTLQKESPLKKYPTELVMLNGGAHGADHEFINMTSIKQRDSETVLNQGRQKHQKILDHIFRKVLVVDSISAAREVVQMLTTKYKDLVHACDTEVAKIDVKTETPVGHGQLICFSIYSGPKADFGNGKSCIWVDVLDGDRNIILEFAPFFEDNSIKKVWHNYSFDFHIIQNYDIKLSGFHADTMHLARLWDSSRRMDGGYSLEALSSDARVMAREQSSMDTGLTLMKDDDGVLIGKISMKDIFGKKKLKKDGSEGKIIAIAPVEELQRGERISWISYSAWDSIKTLELYGCLNGKLMKMPWIFNGTRKGTMFDFYEEYWRPFGIVLVEMEAAGMLIDRGHLSEIEKVALIEQQAAGEKFRKWAATYCHDAIYMNVGSDTQVRQLFFGGIANMKDQNEFLPVSKTFKVPNIDNVIEEGKKSPLKTRSITLHKIGEFMHAEIFTPSGWPSVSADALKTFSGKVSADQIYLPADTLPSDGDILEQGSSLEEEESKESNGYGTAYAAFGKGREGMNACRAIAALCEICSIDSLISNFILPLQGDSISGSKGRIHCSLNINTETGRLSARRPNLQNPPALEKDRYKIRQAFIADPGKSLIVADYGQLELRILAHLASCKSMLDAFEAGGDFHSRTAMNMYSYIREAVENKEVLLEWHPEPGQEKPPVPLLKDAFGAERRKAKMLNFSIAYGKTPAGLSRDWKVSLKEAKETVRLWYNGRQEVLEWQEARKKDAVERQCVHTLLGRARRFPSVANASYSQRGHIERAAINTPVQGSAADVAMCAMLEITRNRRLQDLNWKLLLQVHDEVILEGPFESADEAKAIVVECMSKPFYGQNILKVDLAVDAKCAQNWYAAK